MRSKLPLLGFVLISGAVAFFLAGAQNVPFDSAPAPAVSAGLPLRLRIPSINVDASIEHVGRAQDGAMDVPKDIARAAWFREGPRPGETGSAVIDGHFGWKDGKPAVFDELHAIRPGDMIYVEDDEGVVTAFVARELRTYGEHEDASGVFFSEAGAAHLNLITCGGVWDTTRKTYSDRIVVFADKE